MDIEISLEDLLKNGSHFDHNKKRWNPKMEKYIYGEKNGTHILDLRKSLPLIENALKFAHESSKNNKKFLFVSTKKQHSEIVETIAKETSKMEIGQLVVVKEGTVLAVEGFEGTDQCLRRGGQLAGKKGGAVAVKVAKENHDLRFDIPCLGERTLETCASAGIRVVAFEAGRTLLLDREAVEALAQRHQITVTAV